MHSAVVALVGGGNFDYFFPARYVSNKANSFNHVEKNTLIVGKLK